MGLLRLFGVDSTSGDGVREAVDEKVAMVERWVHESGKCQIGGLYVWMLE
jgi:hypothetical protein